MGGMGGGGIGIGGAPAGLAPTGISPIGLAPPTTFIGGTGGFTQKVRQSPPYACGPQLDEQKTNPRSLNYLKASRN